MAYFYLIPLSIYTGIRMVVLGASVEKWFLVLGALIIGFLLVYYERKIHHIPGKEKLMKLRDKLREN
jgi:predicted acetyltransferase